MACDDIAEHLVMHQILGSGGKIRKDVIANIGAASDYQLKWFVEDRSALTEDSDVLYLSMFNGSSWKWVIVVTCPPSGGGSPW